MRACVVGGGLAGSLLAWRLARATSRWDIHLVSGGRRADATAASGGAVRAYEPDPMQRRLATVSMVELLGSRTLRDWADYRPGEAVTLRRDGDGLDAAVADIEMLLPGSAEVVGPAELERRGWAGLHDGAAAVLERHAGWTSPDRLRDRLLADAVAGGRVTVIDGVVGAVAGGGEGDDGPVTCAVGGERREYDLVVLAAGPWTPALLRASGLPADGWRTKSVQYSVHPVDGWLPTQFVDGVTGLFGRPTADGGLLLGLPTDEWDVDPDRPAATPALHESAVRLARARFPALRAGPAVRRVAAADCYSADSVLALRRVPHSGRGLFTFSGGAGGSAKTALAASSRAAVQLAESGHWTEATSVGRRKGQ